MTLVGKIFTVLVLIMSVAFLMLAVTVFATHRNWKEMVVGSGGLKSQIEELSQTNARLRDEINREKDRLMIEQAARRFALAALQARKEVLEQQLVQRQKEYTDLQEANSVAVGNLAASQMRLEALTKEVEGLRVEIRDAQNARDTHFAMVVELTDKLNAAEGNEQTLKEKNSQLLAQNSRMANVLARNDLTEFTQVDDKPLPVDGVVTAVSEKDLIEISIGADDGLRKGHTLEVYRQNSYVGRVVVVSTEPDRSVAAILREYRRGIIKKGDRVATKLS